MAIHNPNPPKNAVAFAVQKADGTIAGPWMGMHMHQGMCQMAHLEEGAKLVYSTYGSPCGTCRGLGRCSDVEPGDISHREWPCPDCQPKQEQAA